MKKAIALFCAVGLAFTLNAQNKLTVKTKEKEKTAFQTSSAWRPEIDVRSDIALFTAQKTGPA